MKKISILSSNLKSLIIYITGLFLLTQGLVSCAPEVVEPVLVTYVTLGTPPDKVSYYIGDTLELSGLIVKVSYSNQTVRVIDFANFSSEGLTVSISEGTKLSVTDVKIVISLDGFSAEQLINVAKTGSFIDDRDSKVYNAVKIGDQVWMSENLDYAPTDGSIPYVTNDSIWMVDLGNDDPAYCYYNHDPSLGYGCLYTWSAAMNRSSSSDSNPSGIQGICPSGWHLPSYSEWIELGDYLMSNGYNYDGSTSYYKFAKSMASKIGWTYYSEIGTPGNNPSDNNSSGFSALPGGYRFNHGDFLDVNYRGFWWSSTSNYYSSAKLFCLSNFHQDPHYSSSEKYLGRSVRCLRN